MSSISAEDKSLILDMFQRLLTEYHSEERLREIMKTDKGYDPELWQKMAELGITGLLIDPDFDGFGAGAVELELLMEEAGAFLLCSPFFASSVIAASLLGQATDQHVKQKMLPAMANGDKIATVAMTGEKGLWTENDVNVEAQMQSGIAVLNGSASYVFHAQNADILLVLAAFNGQVGLFEVDPNSDGVNIQPLEVNDPTLRICQIEFDAVEANHISGVGSAEIDKAMDLVRIALAGECAGGARKIFDITIDYIANRYQFGRPVGGFQALKHIAADLLIEVENAASAARNAADAFATGSEKADSAVYLAAFYTADAFFEVAAQAIQLHGGIAFTMECPAHLYWRRARTNLQLFGSSDFQREQYLTALENAA